MLGLPLDFLNNLRKVQTEKGELCVVTMKYPGSAQLIITEADILPCLKKAKDDETRKKLEIAFDNRAQENLPTLLEVLNIRKGKENKSVHSHRNCAHFRI